MLVMTLRGYLRQPRLPVLFQPVYIGYERLIEGKSYLDELSGQAKQKESIAKPMEGEQTSSGATFSEFTLTVG